MPAGRSWGQYLSVLGVSLASMMAGASAVHAYYRPDLTLPESIEKPTVAPEGGFIGISAPRGQRQSVGDTGKK